MLKQQDIIIFYDVDGTLAKPFESPPKNICKLISSLDKAGVKQILCSGKGKDYLAGMARGLGISSTSFVIAENGGVIFDWRKQKKITITKESVSKIEEIKPNIKKALAKYCYYEEAKETIITLFFKETDKLSDIVEELNQNIKCAKSQIRHYSDGAIDIIFGCNHKGKAIKKLLKKYHNQAKIFTCGDGVNDLEMLSIGHPITYSGAHPKVVKKVFQQGGTIAEGDGPEGILRAISQLIFEDHLSEVVNHVEYVYRSWGNWEVLTEGNKYKVKKMVVNPKASLSLQKHQYRSEHWFVFEGKAEITINNKQVVLSHGEDYYVPQKAVHKVKNIGLSPLVIIEVQRGKYLGEDDIIRYE